MAGGIPSIAGLVQSTPSSSSSGKSGLAEDAASAISGAVGKGLDLGTAALNTLDRPGQAILAGIHAASTGESTGQGLSDIGKAFTNISGSGDLNLRSALGYDPNAGGRIAGLFDTVGMAALDPTTYLTAGSGKLGEVGLGIIKDQVGENTARLVGRVGINGLDDNTKAAVMDALKSSPDSLKGSDAEAYANKVADKLSQGNALRFAGANIVPAGSVSPITDAIRITDKLGPKGEVVTKGIGSLLKDTSAGKLVSGTFSHLAAVGEKLGSGVQERMSRVLTSNQASKSAADANTLHQLTGQLGAAQKESGLSSADLNGKVAAAFNEGKGSELAAEYEAKNQPLTAKFIRDIESATQTAPKGQEGAIAGTNFSAPTGEVPGLNLSLTGPPQGSLPGLAPATQTARVVTDEGRQALQSGELNAPLNSLKGAEAAPTAATEDALQSLPGHMTPESINTALGKNVLETNPVKIAAHQLVAQNQQKAEEDLAQHLLNLKTDTDRGGSKLVLPESDAAAIKEKGYVGVNIGGQKVFTHPDIAKAVQNFHDLTINKDAAKEGFGKILKGFDNAWRHSATFGVAFHSRIAIGEIMNMFLAGFHDPAMFKKAFDMQKAVSKAGKGGVGWPEALAKSGLSPEDQKLLDAAREKGVLHSGFFKTEFDKIENITKDTKGKVAGAADPLSNSFLLARGNSAFGQATMNNRRLAMFLDSMNKYHNSDIAYKKTVEALFDYNKLTPAERAFKHVMPFYTYTRNNLPLQVKALVTQPGKLAIAGNFRTNMLAGVPGGLQNTTNVPSYLLDKGAIPLTGGDHPLVASSGINPFYSAVDQLSPILDILSQAIPGQGVPGGTQKAAQQILANAGGLGGLPQYLAERATGKNIQTGATEKGGLLNALTELLPAVSKVHAVTEAGGGTNNAKELQLTKSLTGLLASQGKPYVPKVSAKTTAKKEATAAKSVKTKAAKTSASAAKSAQAGKLPSIKSLTTQKAATAKKPK